MNGMVIVAVANPEIWNGKDGGAEVRIWGGAKLPPSQENLWEFYAKIMHFRAKFSLVSRCIQSMGAHPSPWIRHCFARWRTVVCCECCARIGRCERRVSATGWASLEQWAAAAAARAEYHVSWTSRIHIFPSHVPRPSGQHRTTPSFSRRFLVLLPAD